MLFRFFLLVIQQTPRVAKIKKILAINKNVVEFLKRVQTSIKSVQAIRLPTTIADKLCQKFNLVKQAIPLPAQTPVIGAGTATKTIRADQTANVLFLDTSSVCMSFPCFLNLLSSFRTILLNVLDCFSFVKIGRNKSKIKTDERLDPKKLAKKDANGDSALSPQTLLIPKGIAIRASQTGSIDINSVDQKLPPLLTKKFWMAFIIYIVY